MTTDSTQPQSELEQAPANGQAQSQGHRRRRRRRKSKSSQQGAAQAQQPQQSQAAQPQPQAPPPPPQPKPPAPRQNQNQGQGRKKKKFFQKGAPAAVREPGNSISGPPQGKRKGKQKGPREFVGPMDHSYRIANGNVADGPPSTIQIGNGHGGAYYEDGTRASGPPERGLFEYQYQLAGDSLMIHAGDMPTLATQASCKQKPLIQIAPAAPETASAARSEWPA